MFWFLVASGLVKVGSRTVGGQVVYSQVIIHLFLKTHYLIVSYRLEESSRVGRLLTDFVRNADLVVVMGICDEEGDLVNSLVEERQDLKEGPVVVFVQLDVLVVVDHLQTPVGHQRLRRVQQHFGLVTLLRRHHLLTHFTPHSISFHLICRHHAAQELGAQALVESCDLLLIVKL